MVLQEQPHDPVAELSSVTGISVSSWQCKWPWVVFMQTRRGFILTYVYTETNSSWSRDYPHLTHEVLLVLTDIFNSY
jgi:hypothetical protein